MPLPTSGDLPASGGRWLRPAPLGTPGRERGPGPATWQSPARVLAWGGERQVAGVKGRVGRDLAVTEEAKFEAPPRLRD